jgi:hypothetical protein
MTFRYWMLVLASWIGLAAPAAQATVRLTAYTFSTDNLPYIWSDEALPPPYKLRAKIQPNYHATDGWNNHYTKLWSVPGTGYYTVELYWVKYAADYATVVEVGPRNIQTIYIQPAGNAAPTIQWQIKPDVVQEYQPYLIRARGSDSNGNLTQVSIWKQWMPFAFAGGGTGWSGDSENFATDAGGQWIQYQARAADAAGADSGYIYHSVYVNRKPTIRWEVVPSASLAFGTNYSIRARAEDADGNLTTVNIYRNEVPFAFALYGSGSNAYSENPDRITAYGAVTYRAEAFDATGATSGSIYFTVYAANNAPAANWSSTNPGTTALPSGAVRIDGYIGQNYSFGLSAADPDGNLHRVESFQYAWEDESGTWVQRQDHQAFDTRYSVGGAPLANSYSRAGGSPWKWNYQYTAVAFDSAGASDVPVGDNLLFVYLDNRSPAPPTLVSSSTSMSVGQAVTISAAGTDVDRNATAQWLWYRGPDQGPTEWVALTSSTYAAGTDRTLVNFTFTPTKVGIYYFKTRVEDPYAWRQILDVAPLSVVPDTTPPNPPTALSVAGVAPTWAVLNWSLSTSADVGEQHVYWQAVGGGPTTDILLGSAVAGVSVAGLVPGNSYQMYLKARDTSGNYSVPSGSVTVTTPVPVAIASGPSGVTAVPGQTVKFSVAATGTAPLTYRWVKDGTTLADGGIVAGSGTPELTLNGVRPSDAGGYSVVVGNAAGSVLSPTALLTVNSPPSILAHPVSQSANTGQSVTFSVTAAGTGPLTYQWRKNGAAIPGATAASYSIASVRAEDAANSPGYSVSVTNVLGTVTSTAATLAVASSQPIRLALQYWQPFDYPNYSIGGHWDNEDVWVESHWVDGHDEDEWGWDDAGNWTVVGTHWVDGYWEEGHWESQSVWVNETQPDGQYGSRWTTTVGLFDNPLSSPRSAFVPGRTNRGYLLFSYPAWYVVFRVWAYAPSGNCSNFHYTVYHPGGGYTGYSGGIPGGGYSEVWLPVWAWGTGSYRIDITYSGATLTANPTGTVSYYIAYGVPLPPTIVSGPAPESQTVNVGATVAYAVSAANAATYQWRRDGSNIPGGNSALLTIPSVSTSAAGAYDVVVGNATGSTVSLPVRLMVTNEPFGDNDGDGIPNGIEQLLLSDPQTAAAADTGNGTVRLRIIKP